MLSPVLKATEFVTGERMDVEEFLHRWDELPELKSVELIDGVVHVSSPVSRDHGNFDTHIIWWLAHYAQATPGCSTGNNSTWLMLDSAPQPDGYLRILPSHGGQSGDEKRFSTGAPELAVEICLTSTEVDFGPKRDLYLKAGVREYITIELLWKHIVWRVAEDGMYLQEFPTDGIIRSETFPGLWLDVAALWAGHGARMLAALNAGLATEEHQKFVERLAAAR